MLLDIDKIHNLEIPIFNTKIKYTDKLWLVRLNILCLTKILATLILINVSAKRLFLILVIVKTKLQNTSGNKQENYYNIIKVLQEKMRNISFVHL